MTRDQAMNDGTIRVEFSWLPGKTEAENWQALKDRTKNQGGGQGGTRVLANKGTQSCLHRLESQR